MKKKILKVFIVIGVMTIIVATGYFVLKALNLDDLDKLREIVNQGFWGVIIFGLIMVAQVLFLPAGTLIFSGSAVVLFDSPLKAWLVCWIGLAIGSLIMFWIARIWGVKVLRWIVGQKRAKRYAYFLGRGKFVLPMILLVPIFPDDIVCAAAGLSNINWLYFSIVICITRGIDNFCTVFIGAEMIKTTLGLILLGCFVVVMIFASIILTKHQDKIENWFVSKFSRKAKDKNELNKNKE
ncbi:MAG: VTT domain-containing protein [Clostridia bacterium]|nr:VTT domain-containing protein [Clostridia bacterium]